MSGDILVSGQVVPIRKPLDAIHHGMGMVPEDRKNLGLILQMALRENIALPHLSATGARLLDERGESRMAADQVDALDIRTPSLEQTVEFLSGGNQQKVALGKWLAVRPDVLILDEPTRGIDVGSKSEVYRLVRRLADAGVAVIMISSEMEEILGLADRVLVLHEGRQTGIVAHEDMTEERIMHLATGGAA